MFSAKFSSWMARFCWMHWMCQFQGDGEWSELGICHEFLGSRRWKYPPGVKNIWTNEPRGPVGPGFLGGLPKSSGLDAFLVVKTTMNPPNFDAQFFLQTNSKSTRKCWGNTIFVFILGPLGEFLPVATATVGVSEGLQRWVTSFPPYPSLPPPWGWSPTRCKNRSGEIWWFSIGVFIRRMFGGFVGGFFPRAPNKAHKWTMKFVDLWFWELSPQISLKRCSISTTCKPSRWRSRVWISLTFRPPVGNTTMSPQMRPVGSLFPNKEKLHTHSSIFGQSCGAWCHFPSTNECGNNQWLIWK